MKFAEVVDLLKKLMQGNPTDLIRLRVLMNLYLYNGLFLAITTTGYGAGLVKPP